jgi:PAS domain S-box-containing protein
VRSKDIGTFIRNFGIKKKLFLAALLSVLLSIGITSLINSIQFSNNITSDTKDRIAQISISTNTYTIEKIRHQLDLLITISISEQLKEQLRRENNTYALLTEEDRTKRINEIEAVWASNDEKAVSLIQEIYGNSISKFLLRFKSAYAEEVELFVTDKYGQIYAMSNMTSDYLQSDEEWWQKSITGNIFISYPTYDESSQTWAIILSVPVFDNEPGSKVIGIVRGTVDITSVFDSIFNPDITDYIYGAFVSSDGYAYIQADEKLQVQKLTEDAFLFLDSGFDDVTSESKDINGVPVLAAKTRLEINENFLGWIVIFVHKSWVTESIYSTILSNIFVGLVLTIILGGMSILFSNSILNVLRDLKQDASHLAIGDYSYRFSNHLINSSDPDISSLVNSIEGMKIAIQIREEKIRSREREYRQLIETMNEGLVVVGTEGMVSYVNPRMCQLIGYSQEEIIGKGFLRFFVEERRKSVIRMWKTAEQSSGQIYESKMITSLGKIVDVSISTEPQFDETGRYTGLLAIVTDISDRKAFELNLQRKLNEISGLREIDTSILEQANYFGVVDTVLKQFKEHLHADGAAIYVISPQTNAVDYASAYFLNENYDHEILKIDHEQINRIANIKDGQKIQKSDDHMIVCNFLRDKNFNIHYLAPIVINDVFHGLAEIFYFDDVKLDKEWHNYFNALLTQTAVGISKIELMDHLRKRNLELKEAYDGIIKGWAKALELRDEETKGHSDRVFELSIKMAERYQFSASKFEAFRRGALLHDIGKMGIPDSILLKPGKLTPEEWDIMKLHPDLAYVLLSEIPFLKDAVEIPYYHHERWNGSGYPSGLKGEDIPLAARIFAVIDVWDALTSDRPYRKAWSVEETRSYMIENKAVLFDPDIVDQFLDLLKEEGGL